MSDFIYGNINGDGLGCVYYGPMPWERISLDDNRDKARAIVLEKHPKAKYLHFSEDVAIVSGKPMGTVRLSDSPYMEPAAAKNWVEEVSANE